MPVDLSRDFALFPYVSRRGEAEEALQAAKESGNQEEIEKYSKRSVKVRRHGTCDK